MIFFTTTKTTITIYDNKYLKLRPLENILKNCFLKYFVFGQAFNYDENTVKYFSRHSCKQFIRGKRIQFGFKAWRINTSTGYLLNYDFY